MRPWRADVLFGGLVGLALGTAAAFALCASSHPSLERPEGLGLALGTSAVIGAATGAIARARTAPGQRPAATTLFAAVAAVAVCLLFRRVGWSDLNLYGFGAGFAPWGRLAAVSMPLVGLAVGALTAVDARAGRG